LTGFDDWMVWVAQDFVSMSQEGLRPMRVRDWEARLVRYVDLRPCYNAFIDCRSPGSEAKENFTIIGPGVSENPDQYVHIAEIVNILVPNKLCVVNTRINTLQIMVIMKQITLCQNQQLGGGSLLGYGVFFLVGVSIVYFGLN
jgi:hypothetical protein